MTVFPITAWPEGRIEVPERLHLRGQFEYEAHGDFIYRRVIGMDHGLGALDDEIYLREMRTVDVNDNEALADFATRFGHLTLAPRATDHVPYATLLWTARSDYRLRAHLLQQMHDTRPARPKRRGEFHFAGTADEMRAAIKWVRDLSMIAICQSQHPPGDDEVTSYIEAQWQSDIVSAPRDDLSAVRMLASGLDAGLSPLRFLHFANLVEPTRSDDWRAFDSVPRLTFALIDLRNHLVERAAFRVCDECQGFFVRQRGGAKKGQHRTRDDSLRFCSTACGSKARVRRHRQKKRMEAE